MTVQMTPDEQQVERQQVEAVFALGGGELDEEPMEYRDMDGQLHKFQYYYDGVPEYARSDYPDQLDGGYFTAVTYCLFGLPPEHILANDQKYQRVNYFWSSGETECPCRDCDEDPFEGKECPLCGRPAGEEHGHVYLGDGWCEVVYKEIR